MSVKKQAKEIEDKLRELRLPANREAETYISEVVGWLQGIQEGVNTRGNRRISELLVKALSAMPPSVAIPNADFEDVTEAIQAIASSGIGIDGYHFTETRTSETPNEAKKAATAILADLSHVKITHSAHIPNHVSAAHFADAVGLLEAVESGVLGKGSPLITQALSEARNTMLPLEPDEHHQNLRYLKNAIIATAKAGLSNETHVFDKAAAKIAGPAGGSPAR